jgi:hypothetical protein
MSDYADTIIKTLPKDKKFIFQSNLDHLKNLP